MRIPFQCLKRNLVLCYVVFFGYSMASAQTTKVDELLKELKKSTSDTAQIRVMRKLSVAYSSVDPTKKFYYANQYKLLAEKNGIDSLVSCAYLDMGISYGIRSKLDSALYYFSLGHEKAKASNYLIGIARSHSNIGYAYDRLDNKKAAVKSYEEALKIFNKLNKRKGINQCITNLGSIYFDLGEYKIADSYFKQVLESVMEDPNDQSGLANAFFSLGNSNRKLGNSKKSFEYYEKSLAIRQKLGDLNGIALSSWGIGQLYVNKEDYKTALGYLEVALKNNRILKNLYHESVVLLSTSHAFLGLKDYKKAEEMAKMALQKAKESNSKGLTSEALELLVTINKEQNKFSEALLYQSDYIAVKDSLDIQETKKDVIMTDFNRIRSENKDLEEHNETISSKNTDYVRAIFITSLLLFFVVVLLVLFYRRNLEKKTTNALLQKQKEEIAHVNKELEALNEELTSQMDITSAQNAELEKLNMVKNKFFSIVSHDLRSPLATLKMLFGLYREGELNEKELNELLINLEDTIYTTAVFLDNLLEWSKSQLDGIVVKPSVFDIHHVVEQNIRLMDSQIKLKELRIENRIQKEIKVFADPNMINVVIRNLVSNAIKFCNSDDLIIVDALIENGNVVFLISDTGPGISEVNKENLFNLEHTISTGTSGEKGHHIGLILCKDMIEQNNGTIRVSSQLGKGTTFYISLPLGLV